MSVYTSLWDNRSVFYFPVNRPLIIHHPAKLKHPKIVWHVRDYQDYIPQDASMWPNLSRILHNCFVVWSLTSHNIALCPREHTDNSLLLGGVG